MVPGGELTMSDYKTFVNKVEDNVKHYNTFSFNVQQELDAKLSVFQDSISTIDELIDDNGTNHLEAVVDDIVAQYVTNQFNANAAPIHAQVLSTAYGLTYDSILEAIKEVGSGTFGSRQIVAVMDSISRAMGSQLSTSVTTEMSKLSDSTDLRRAVAYTTHRFGFDDRMPTFYQDVSDYDADVKHNREFTSAIYRGAGRMVGDEYSVDLAKAKADAAKGAAKKLVP